MEEKEASIKAQNLSIKNNGATICIIEIKKDNFDTMLESEVTDEKVISTFSVSHSKPLNEKAAEEIEPPIFKTNGSFTRILDDQAKPIK